MKSKENRIIELFFENPTREWHFEEIVSQAKIARSKADSWLKRFVEKKLIKKIKEKGRMPFYVGNYSSSEYIYRKRIFALNRFYESGFLDHLYGLQKAKTIIIFGSFARSDWYKESDIDIFIYGKPEGLKIAKYEKKIGHDIQLFICENKKDIAKLGNRLIRNVVKGSLIKGNLDFIEVAVSA